MFIVFEGIDGCGKGTQVKLMEQFVKNIGYDVWVVHDPGTTPAGLAIRELVLAKDLPMSPQTQSLLYAAARTELSQKVAEKLKDGYVVIGDRWLASTIVYQCYMDRVPLQAIFAVASAYDHLVPDMTIILDLAVSVARGRMGRDARADRFESRDDDWYERLRAAYCKVEDHLGIISTTEEDGKYAVVLDCMNRDEQQVHREAIQACYTKSHEFAIRMSTAYFNPTRD